MTLKIEAGKFYRTRDGRKVGPMRETGHPSGTLFERFGDGRAWFNDGSTVHEDKRETLVAEWAEEPEAAHFASREEMVSAIPVPTPDYNDGNWHGWNGGECPVHPQSVVEYVWHDIDAGKAGFFRDWAGPLIWSNIIRFRVVKPYTAPREWWIVGDCEAYASEAEALEACKALYGNPTPVHVREVKE